MSDDVMSDFEDLFSDEEGSAPEGVPADSYVKVLSAGSGEQYIPFTEGMILSEVLDRAGQYIRPGTSTQTFVNGERRQDLTGTVVAGDTVSVLGAVKGG